MRSTLVSAALVLVVAATSSCRPFRGGPSRAGADPAVGDAAVPSGLGTRAVYRLPNGLRVVLEENHAAPVVALQAWIGAGGGNDPAGQEGLAHLFQHLLLHPASADGGSADAAPAAQAARDLAAVRARVGAWTTVDDTVVAGVLAAPFVDVGVRALAALLIQPSMAPQDIAAARRSARDDLRQAVQVPERVAAQAALTTAFPGHPYGRPLMGTEASLAGLGVAQIQAFWEAFYTPDHTTLVIVGDFDAAATRALVLAAFGGWRSRRGSSAGDTPRPQDPTAPQVAVATGQVPAPQVAIAFRIPGMKAADLPALELLAALLGPRRGGRLEMEVVRNRQLVTAPRAFLFNAHQGGLLVTTATLGPGRADEAARAIRDEMLRLAGEPVSADELARARTVVEGDGAIDKATIGGYARKLGMSMAVAGDPSFESAYLDRLRKVDPGDLRKVAARTFVSTNLSLTVVLPSARDPQRDDRAASLLPRLRIVASAPPPPRSGPAPSSAAAVTASGHDVMEYLLPSGVRLLVLRDDTAPQLSVRAVWPGGVRVQDARLAGASSLLARLLPRGTKTRAADALANELAEVAGTIDGAASMDSLAVRGDFLASRWERGLELMVDCLRNPRLSDEDIERERRVLLDAIRARNDDPTEIALRLFQGALFGRHPYNQDLLGTSDSVAGLNRRRLLDHFRQHYGPAGLTLAVVGPLEPQRISAKVQSLFADARPAAAERGSRDQELATVIAQPPHTEPAEVFQFITKDQGRLVLGFPGVTLRDPDRYALEVLAEVLGGAGGRMGAAGLRALGLLPDQAGAVSHEGVDPGYFALYLAARPDALDALVPALRAELRGLVERGVSEEEVARARRIVIGNRALALERRGAVAMAVALNDVFGGAGRSYRRDVDDLARVTAVDVARAARRILDPRREVLAVVRPRDPAAPGQRPTTATVLTVRPPRYTSR